MSLGNCRTFQKCRVQKCINTRPPGLQGSNLVYSLAQIHLQEVSSQLFGLQLLVVVQHHTVKLVVYWYSLVTFFWSCKGYCKPTRLEKFLFRKLLSIWTSACYFPHIVVIRGILPAIELLSQTNRQHLTKIWTSQPVITVVQHSLSISQ